MKNKYLILISAFILTCFMYSCELDSEFVAGEVPTISNLTISSPTTLNCELPCSVTFSATSQLTFPVTVGDQVTYAWDFGDGSAIDTGNNIVHEYTALGDYDIKLTASAMGAMEVSINQTFSVNPKSTFISTTSDADKGYDILEVSDGFVVFGFSQLFRFNKQGDLTKSIDVTNFLPGYTPGDFHVIDEDNFLLMGNNGMYADVDNNLNFSNVNTTISPQIYPSALVTVGNELKYFGGAEGWVGLIIDLAFQTGGTIPLNFDQYVHGGYSQIINFPIELFSKHKQIDDHFFAPVKSGLDDVLFGSDGNIYWFTETFDYEVQSISDGLDNNILTLGYESPTGMILQEVDKTSGTLGQKIDICPSDIPGGLLKVDDGFIVVTTTNENDPCMVGHTIEGDTDVRIQKLDLLFNPVWDRVVNTAGFDSIREVRQASDGGFLITGYNRLNSTNRLFLIKTNAEGMAN